MAGVRDAKAVAETSATTRVAGTVAGVRDAKAVAETSATTRVAGTVAGGRTGLDVNRAILAIEGIQARGEGETEGVERTRAFFIRIILRVLWRRALR